MKKTIKLRTGIFAAAMMLMCNSHSWAQAPADPVLIQSENSVSQAKQELQTGISSGTLTPQQISEKQAKIAAMHTQGTVAQPTAAVTPKQVTRAEFMQMSQDQQKLELTGGAIEISDLVNGTKEDSKTANVTIISVEEFRSFDVLRKRDVLNNPGKYKIVKIN